MPRAQARPSPSVCMYVRVMLPLLLPRPGACIHTGMHAHAGLGTWPPEPLPELDLMQTFLCLPGRGTSEGPGSKPVRPRATAGQGEAPGFRHTTTTRARAHACLVCSSHMLPPTDYTHTSHAVHPEATHVSHTSVSPHLPLTCCPSPTHPGTPSGSCLVLSLPPAWRSPAQQGM